MTKKLEFTPEIGSLGITVVVNCSMPYMGVTLLLYLKYTGIFVKVPF